MLAPFASCNTNALLLERENVVQNANDIHVSEGEYLTIRRIKRSGKVETRRGTVVDHFGGVVVLRAQNGRIVEFNLVNSGWFISW